MARRGWRIRICAVGAVAAGVLLAGCGGSGDDPGGGDPGDGGSGPDPCTLLTAAEVTAVAGAEATGPAGPTDANQGASCQWSFPAEVLGEVTVSVWVGREFYSPDTVPAGFEAVPGIGDAAHQATGGMLVCTAIFRIGEVVVQVISTGAGEDACVELARTAAGRV